MSRRCGAPLGVAVALGVILLLALLCTDVELR